MKKKFILFALILSVLCIGGGKINSLNAQETITIGEESSTTYGYLPTVTTSNTPLTQQIYTSDEINKTGTITRIAFKVAYGGDVTRKFDVYMENIDGEKKSFGDGDKTFLVTSLVYSGEVVLKDESWVTIELTTPFEYNGGSLLLCINDCTNDWEYNNSTFYVYSTNKTSVSLSSSKYDPTKNQYNVKSWSDYRKDYNNQIQFTFGAAAPAEPSLTVSEESIDLGDVRMCWTEKPVTATVEVAYENTDAPVITSSDEFFTVSYNASSSPFNLTIGYDKTKSGKSEGTITITTGDLVETIAVTAAPYTPATGDVWESAPVVDLSTGTFNSGEVTGMYDDYILPGETVDGNLNDAVYQFTLDKDALITATVEGKNPIVAIYDEDFGKKDGPSLDNNNTGVQNGPTGPTTFECGFEDASSMDNFTYDQNVWSYYNSYGFKGAKASDKLSRMATKNKYVITENSQFSLTYTLYNSEKVVVEISEDGSSFTVIGKFDTTGGATNTINLSEYNGMEVYFAVSIEEYGSPVFINNLQLTDGSAKSRGSEAQIDGVHYTAGTYYLVAAAEGNFTLNLRKVDYIAIDAPQVVGGGSTLNKLVGETVTLEWSTVEGVDGYRVYKGEDVLAELENNTYEIELNDYNVTPGYTFYVTAYIGENESPKSEPIYVKVSGDVNINGTLTNGAGATLTFTGTDEFGQAQTYTTIVGNNGSYTIEINAGHYTMTASKFDYQDFSEEIDIEYSVESVTLEHAMIAKPSAGDAIVSVRMSETQSGATISWSANAAQNADQKYNIYRKDVEREEVTSIVKNQTLSSASNYWDGSYVDDTYSSLQDGKSYQYGVTAMVTGEPVEVMREGFENNNTNLPNGWTKTGSIATVYDGSGYYYSGSYGCYLYYATLTSPNIDLSAYMSSSISFYCKNSSNTKLYLKVKATDSNAWTIVAEVSNINSFNKITAELPDRFKGKVIQIMFDYQGTSYPAIDDIVISASLSVESQAVWSTPLKKGLNTFTNKADGDDWNKWEVAANWSKGLPTSESEVIINGSVQIASDVIVKSLSVGSGSVVINNNASLTVTDEMVNNTSYKLTILDGGQLKQHSSDVKAVFSMNIVAPESWSSNDSQYNDGWQFIASPFTNSAISYFTYNAVYDLYRYNGSNQGEEWINHKDNEDAYTFETNFENGVGYLASRQNGGAVSFSGTLNYKTSFEKPLSYKEGEPLANFHLLGNPFSFNMDWDNVDLVNVYDGFATIDPATGGYVKSVVSGVTTIPVGDGFFVEAIGETPSISYPAQSKSRGEEKIDYINIIATGAEGSNNLIVKFSGAEEKGFSKLENINPNIADIYVVNNGRQYSILGYDRDVQEIALNFDAKQMGNYSISLDINGKFENVTLVDRFTGIETNMLIEDEYSFTATSNDSHERFFIRLDNGQESTADSQFVFQSGEELILSIEGTVQIVDMLGRVVYSNDHSNGNNRISVSEFNNAAYVVRVINEEGVKVQKVVIY